MVFADRESGDSSPKGRGPSRTRRRPGDAVERHACAVRNGKIAPRRRVEADGSASRRQPRAAARRRHRIEAAVTIGREAEVKHAASAENPPVLPRPGRSPFWTRACFPIPTSSAPYGPLVRRIEPRPPSSATRSSRSTTSSTTASNPASSPRWPGAAKRPARFEPSVVLAAEASGIAPDWWSPRPPRRALVCEEVRPEVESPRSRVIPRPPRAARPSSCCRSATSCPPTASSSSTISSQRPHRWPWSRWREAGAEALCASFIVEKRFKRPRHHRGPRRTGVHARPGRGARERPRPPHPAPEATVVRGICTRTPASRIDCDDPRTEPAQ